MTQRFESQGRVAFELFLSSIDEGRISFIGNMPFSGKTFSKNLFFPAPQEMYREKYGERGIMMFGCKGS